MNPYRRNTSSRWNGGIRVVLVSLAIAAPPIAAFATVDGDKPESKSKADAPRYIAARFHADWCATCLHFAPHFEKLLVESSDMPVLFVTFDVTSKVTQRQGEFLASGLGIDRVWSDQGNRVGVINLIDTTNKRLVATISIGEGYKKVEAAIRAAVSRKSTD